MKIMLAQGTGGCLLFNVSSRRSIRDRTSAPTDWPKPRPFSSSRQYALDHGGDGIRANAVNADRIRYGLLTNDFITERAKARGVAEKDY